jgi:P27 family predicted phage terminase small subunit
MGAGRPRKPTKLKIIEGNRGKRPLDPSAEPEPTKGIPASPELFTDLERRVWDMVAGELNAFGMAYLLDGPMLEGLVVNYCRAVAADQVIRDKGMTYEMETKTGTMVMRRPEVDISSTCWKNAKSFASDFGLTMAARGKLALGNNKEVSDLDSILNGTA